jgi:hypothetical protein
VSTIADCDTAITLKPGHLVPFVALQLTWKMEELGVSLSVEDDALVLRPSESVPTEDIPLLRKYRRDIMRLITYTAEPV